MRRCERKRAEVESLLAAHREANGFLSRAVPTPDLQGTYISPTTIEAPGMQIGPYILREQLGEGGMGIVYVAEQTEPVRRKVALKIIKPGMDSKEVIARFEAERQALAMMSHPNIAKVLDGGTTEQGRPYFVMELVKGIPITTFCDERRLSLRDRLELFVTVCEAVQHAHLKGIIHRDLKPSNVLVEMHDVKSVPKVIDFGIAKAINQQLTQQTVYTHFAQLVGTPLYMSPEQAELSGLDVDTRSDVYSLGVMLYELLSGVTPFDESALSSVGLDEMRRIIREDEPPRPSYKVSLLEQAQISTISVKRQVDPRQLSLSMQRELDWIVMKALEKDRTRRYESASDLAHDIQRYLDDKPVEACPPSLTYRLRKFSRRHQKAITFCVVVVVVLIVGVASTAWQAIRANEAAVEAKAEAERANANLKLALSVVDEMYTEVAENSLRRMPGAQEFRLRILERALQFYGTFAEENAGSDLRYETAMAWRRVGEIHHRLQQNSESRNALNTAIATFESLVKEQPDEARYREKLASTYWFLSKPLEVEGEFEKSERCCRKAQAIQQELVAEFPQNYEYKAALATTFHQLGHVLQDSKERTSAFTASIKLFKKLHAWQPDNNSYTRQLAHDYAHLGEIMHVAGEIEQAEDAYRTSIELLETANGPADADVVDSYDAILAGAYRNWGTFLRETNRPVEGEAAHRKAVHHNKALAESFPTVIYYRSQLGLSQIQLGLSLRALERNSEAGQCFDEAHRLFTELESQFPDNSEFRNRREEVEHLLVDDDEVLVVPDGQENEEGGLSPPPQQKMKTENR